MELELPASGRSKPSLTVGPRGMSPYVLDRANWEKPLSHFSRATGLAVTAYRPDGVRSFGPFTSNPITDRFKSAGVWADGSTGAQFERGLVTRAIQENATVVARAFDLLPVFAIPIRARGQLIGVFLAGWIFEHFADPIEGDRLARALGVSTAELWVLIRMQNPISREKLVTYAELFRTIIESLGLELSHREDETRRASALTILNQSAQRLAATTEIQEIEAAAADAGSLLAPDRRIRLVLDIAGFAPNTLAQPTSYELGPEHQREGGRFLLRLPIQRHDGAAMGWLEVEGFKKLAPELEAELVALASQIAVALQRVRLISDLRRERQVLQTTLEKLKRASIARDEFLATVSHELRTPLTAILGWCQLLRKGLVTDDNRAVAFEAIDRSARLQSQLVEDLLDVSRIISGKLQLTLEPVSLSSLVSAAVETVRPAADQKQIQILLSIESAVDTVRADPVRLQQVIWNLLSNAVKFTGSGGKVWIRIFEAVPGIVIEVRDNGEGIVRNMLPFLFDRFIQADSSAARVHGGLGLGLAIARHIVELHGGAVSAKSDGPGEGSTFTVLLPRSSVSENYVAPTTSGGKTVDDGSDALLRLDGVRVLVVEDVLDSLQFITATLTERGAEVKTSMTAQQGAELHKQWNPDILLSDIGLPGEDGLSLIKNLRALPERSPRFKAVAISAYAKAEDRIRALEAGYDDYLVKPIEPLEMVRRLAALCADQIEDDLLLS